MSDDEWKAILIVAGVLGLMALAIFTGHLLWHEFHPNGKGHRK